MGATMAAPPSSPAAAGDPPREGFGGRERISIWPQRLSPPAENSLAMPGETEYPVGFAWSG
jgi:hypothetical protein